MSDAIMPLEMTIGETTPINIDLKKTKNIDLNLNEKTCITNYPALSDKPQINNITLIGNKTGKELKLQDEMSEITNQEIDNIIFN